MCGDTPQSGDFMLFEMLDQVRVSARNMSASFVEVQGSFVEMQGSFVGAQRWAAHAQVCLCLCLCLCLCGVQMCLCLCHVQVCPYLCPSLLDLKASFQKQQDALLVEILKS